MDPTREIFWNIEHLIEYAHYIGFVIISLLILYILYRRTRLWRMGKSEERFDNFWKRVTDVIWYGFIQRRIFKDWYAGIMHILIFSGIGVLIIGTAIVTIEADLPVHFFYGNFFLA